MADGLEYTMTQNHTSSLSEIARDNIHAQTKRLFAF